VIEIIIFAAMNKVYGCVVDMEDHLVRKEGGKFSFVEFQAHPERYASTFSRKVTIPGPKKATRVSTSDSRY